VYVALVNGNRLVGYGIAMVGLAWSLFAVFVIEKHYQHPGTLTYAHSRFGYFGHGIGGAVSTIFRHPGVVLGVVFTWSKVDYLFHLLAPTGFLALLAPQALLIGTPIFALNLLSTDFHMVTGAGDNSAELISVVFIAGVLGARHVLRFLRRWISPGAAALSLTTYVLVCALLTQHLYGFTPLGNRYVVPSIGSHQRLADQFVTMIPPSVPVSTQDQLDPHLSSRRYVYLFLDTGRIPPLAPANYILLDVTAPTYPLPSYQLYQAAESFLRQPSWGVAAAEDGLLLIKKGAANRSIPGSFYRFALATQQPLHRLNAFGSGLQLTGYDLQQSDLANHSIPNLSYSFFARLTRRLHTNVQPIVYEVMNNQKIGCVHEPLGLAWLPTTQWKFGTTYVIRMDPLETRRQTFGTAHFYVELRPSAQSHEVCSKLWRAHGKLWSVGTLNITP
jgi:hypothetical protein